MDKIDNYIIKVLKTENSFLYDDIDIINVIKRYLLHSYSKKLSLLYKKVEQDQFFSSLLSIDELDKINKEKQKLNEIYNKDEKIKDNEMIKKIIQKTIDTYLSEIDNKDNIKYEQQKIFEEREVNEINIILGLKLPGINSVITQIIKYFKKEIFKPYRIQEDNLRAFIELDEIEEKVNKYRHKLSVFNNNTFIELNKNITLCKIINNYNYFEKSEFYKLFLEDYYTLFIQKIFRRNNYKENINKIDKNNYYEIKKMLKLIIKIRNNCERDEELRNIASLINWIECYSIEIGNILNMFSKLNSIIYILYDEIEKIINNNEIEYAIPNKRQEYTDYTSIVNKALFYGMESILKVITSNEYIYDKLIKEEEKFKKFMNVIKEIYEIFSILNNNLFLYSKEIYSL